MKLRFIMVLMSTALTVFFLEKTQGSNAQEVYPGEYGDWRICKISRSVFTTEKFDVMDIELGSDESHTFGQVENTPMKK